MKVLVIALVLVLGTYLLAIHVANAAVDAYGAAL